MRFSRRRGVRRQPRLKFESLEPRWAFHGETLNSVPAYSSPAPTTEPTAIESSSGVQVFNFDGPSNSNVAPSPSEVVPNEVVPNEVVPNEESDTSETTSDNSTFTVTPTTLLPDLTLWDHSLFGFNHLEYLDVHPKTGHKLLRLSTAGVNVGQGPMILEGREVTNGFQRVSQIVRMSDGTTIEYPAGEYVYHATHDHIHFADYAEYNLRSIIDDHGVGPIVATGGKVSFCLMDNAAYDLSLPSAPSTVVFSTCNRFTQGMSVGWADIYSAAVDDQWIDIEGVPDGEYWLETVLDPTNLLRESNEDNNTIRNRVVIGQPTYSPDVYDAAGQFDPHLGTGDQRIHGLSVHAPGEVDRFRWIAPADGEMLVTLTFDRTLGDTDLYVWGSSTNSQIDIQSSTTDGNIEQISYPVRAGETYFVVVRDLAGYTLPDYTLAVDGPDIVPDRLEPNNSILELTHVDTGEQKLTNLNVHAPGDLDYYAWKADRTSNVMLDLRFTHYEGDLNLFIYDFQNQQIGKSTTTTNREFLEFPAIGGEVYLIVVSPEPEARSINYELRITPQTILPDPLEPNDSEHAPYDIGSGNVRLTGLTIEKPFNRDVYKWRAVAQGMAKVDLLFKHADGDLELLLWRDGEEVLLSRTQNDNEHFEFPVLPQQMFLLEVRGRNDAMSPHYDLLVDGTEAPRVLQTNVRRASDLGDESTMLWPGHAADSVPWTDIATIEMVFSKDVLFGDNSLELISEQLEVTRLSLDTYDASRHAAVWKLPTLLAAGNWKIRLPDSVTDAEGNPLDGETIESGNGSGNGIPGGEFILPILVTPGDFTGDRQVDAEDISALFAGLPLTLRRFDLNNDRKSNELDIVYLLKDVMGSTIGDANLDGLFDSADLVQIFQRGQFEDLVVHNSAWADGDWNGDGEFDTGDMVFAFQQGGYII